jgi:adenosyl cobinamide kinase/adenosyl cobinamide phosphate guanylyltransferase
MSQPLVVILGGTRSGKSRLGRDRAAELAGGGDVTFIGTALPGDPELDARIALHRADRPAGWATIEPGPDLDAAIRSVAPTSTVLLDGLTLWVSQLLGDDSDPPPDVAAIVDGPIESLRAALAAHHGPAIVVSDEVGLGMVPMSPLGRAFRDVLGIAHQRLVADADEAWLTVAGRALRLDDGRRI